MEMIDFYFFVQVTSSMIVTNFPEIDFFVLKLHWRTIHTLQSSDPATTNYNNQLPLLPTCASATKTPTAVTKTNTSASAVFAQARHLVRPKNTNVPVI